MINLSWTTDYWQLGHTCARCASILREVPPAPAPGAESAGNNRCERSEKQVNNGRKRRVQFHLQLIVIMLNCYLHKWASLGTHPVDACGSLSEQQVEKRREAHAVRETVPDQQQEQTVDRSGCRHCLAATQQLFMCPLFRKPTDVNIFEWENHTRVVC